MITVHLWVLFVLTALAGVAVGYTVASSRRSQTDMVVADRVEAMLADALAALLPETASAADPWAAAAEVDYHYLPEPALPAVDTSWRPFGTRPDGSQYRGDDTVGFSVAGFVMPEPKPKPVDDEPSVPARDRFEGEPRLPEPAEAPLVQSLRVELPDKLAPGLPGEVIESHLEVAR